MRRFVANVVCVFFDIFAISAIYYSIYQPLVEIFAGFANRDEIIRIDTTFYLAFGAVCLPMIHTIGLIETYLPRYFNKKICGKVVLGSFIIPVLIGLGVGNWVKQEIVHNGYIRCKNTDVHRKLLRIRVYAINDDTCRRLILEEENRRLGYR